jgi:hypothetical protein
VMPYFDPAMPGINEDPRMGYYEEMAKIPTCMHLERRTEEEIEGIFFVLLMLRNYSSRMGFCVRISIATLQNH